MAVAGGLLAVHAHPDDETLATGALLAAWAAAGERVTVVTCTRGERGEVIDSRAHPTGLAALEWDGPRLAAHRETELAAALGALGVAEHVFLDEADAGDGAPGGAAVGARVPYEDSGMAWVAPGIASAARDGVPPGAFVAVPLDEAASRLAAVIRDRRPRVVVTYEPGGGYGHPDHVRAAEVTVRALELAADAGVEELWRVVVPGEELRAARRELAARVGAGALPGAASGELTLPDPDERVLPPVATWWPDAAWASGARAGLAVVDVRPVLGRVARAMRAHATQVQAVTTPEGSAAGDGVVGWYALSNDVLAPILARETYAVVPLAGRPAATGTVSA